MKRTTRNLRNYFLALVVLAVCAGGYNMAATELLRVPNVSVVPPRPPTQDDATIEDLANLFPADAWQLGKCKRLSTERGTLLFQSWRQISESQWKLEPLTIVFGRGLSENDAESTPIVLTAEDGAEIQFAQSLDVTMGSAPPIKIGRMIGDVEIHRAGDVEPGENLNVKTRNVWIDKQKVWTTERIAMKIGRAILNGRDLTIHLASSVASATRGSKTSAILDSMDLVYLEELRIPLDRPNAALQRPRRIGDPGSEQNGVVSVRCDNGIKYDFALDRMSLADSVVMTRSINGVPTDRFDCDTLSLVLRDPSNQAIARQGPLDWIDRIHATGQPAKLHLKSYDFELGADTIDFDAFGGLLRADGSGGIEIRRGMIRARLASLAYQYDPATPDVLGVIDVNGSGNVSLQSPEIAVKNLRWSEAFKLQPTQAVTIDAMKQNQSPSKFSLRIDGSIHAILADGGTATAGSIQGILKTTANGSTSVSNGLNPRDPNTVTEPDEKRLGLVPEVFHATGGVSVQSSQVLANTDQLSLYFEQAAHVTEQAASRSLANSGTSNRSEVDQNAAPSANLASWVNQPDPQQQVRSPVARLRPQLTGDLISAKLLLTPENVQAKDVSIKGNVKVKHHVQVGPSLLPVEISGESMRAVRGGVVQSSGQDYLQIGSGPKAPAELRMGDGYFIGPMIKVWPTDNIVQVTGAGKLQVPSDLLKQASPPDDTPDDAPDVARDTGSATANVQWKTAPTCRWGQAMQFDGQLAVLDGGVTIDAELISGDEPWTTSMTGRQMQIALSKPVDLMDRGSMAAAEIYQISLVQSETDPVVVRAEQRDAQQTLRAVHLINARQLDFAPRGGGQLLGSGPGWYRGWMLTDNKTSMLAAGPAADDAVTGEILQGVHLTFRDEMRGDLKTETLRFSGGVRTGMRKLQSWDELVDVNQMDRLAVGEMTMSCGRLKFGLNPGIPRHFADVPGVPRPWEMVAEEGVVMRSNTETRGLIEANAARASYESQKGWLVIEGAPGRDASISQTRPDGKPGMNFHPSTLSINLNTYEMHTIMRDAQLNNVPTPQR